jgi:hypothetical protein
MRTLVALLLIGLTNPVHADATPPPSAPPAAPAEGPACASAAQLAAVEQYCSTADASEQRACRIVRRALRGCTAERSTADDGTDSFVVPNPKPKRAIDQWQLDFRRRGAGSELIRFVRELDDDCDCC